MRDAIVEAFGIDRLDDAMAYLLTTIDQIQDAGMREVVRFFAEFYTKEGAH